MSPNSSASGLPQARFDSCSQVSSKRTPSRAGPLPGNPLPATGGLPPSGHPAGVHARLNMRHENGNALRWHLARSAELDAILEAVGLEDLSIEASGLTAHEVAELS